MANSWAYVQNGVVVERRPSLPTTWGNVTGTNNWTVEQAIANGWYPYVSSNRPDPGIGEVVEMVETVQPGVQVVQSWTVRSMTSQELAEQNAMIESEKDSIVLQIDQDVMRALFRTTFNHENRLRALVRGVRAIATTAQRNTLDNQGVEPTRPDLTVDQFKAAIRAIL